MVIKLLNKKNIYIIFKRKLDLQYQYVSIMHMMLVMPLIVYLIYALGYFIVNFHSSLHFMDWPLDLLYLFFYLCHLYLWFLTFLLSSSCIYILFTNTMFSVTGIIQACRQDYQWRQSNVHLWRRHRSNQLMIEVSWSSFHINFFVYCPLMIH